MPLSDPTAYSHGSAPKTAILLVNLGTPDAPTASALRRYLGEFLSDPRVVEIPKPVWWLILNGIILPIRSSKSAAKYASVWTERGSPLQTGTADLTQAVAAEMARLGHHVQVRYAMRYGNPSVASVLDEMAKQNVTRILLVPLYPQYCAATTASTLDAVTAWMRRSRRMPELRVLNHFHDEPLYIEALARKIEAHWQQQGRPDKFVMSFHGMPARTLKLGDPYHCECHKTGRLLAERLGLAAADYAVTFQSRFGKQEWLQPYTEPTLRQLAKEGVARVDVTCPGFSVDCLETLEEIAMEGKEAFLSSGGKVFHYIDCLNAEAHWAQGFSRLLTSHLQGWNTTVPADPKELAQTRERAKALGAENL
ncbi:MULTISPECIES: ferrochelatase [unclassified Thiomonas]|jgi:ferrochelatase|uniref:ferrochelatase n=1 Tax=unclassified Thiomonas TaxID=2625466 RepID=UPI0004DBC7D4|nr:MULTISPECIES: ferrochelatase [unclassified Thiomonas]MDD5000523.1 ferrochelatase [Thiomonas arsenitoxydans]OYV31642.1 MAG: ferrochelatase [Thiomonas sp. 20-64-9]OZB72303.1 MAG: ferrochelatase [Thiomonas sp. 13-64-67]CDW95928.1 ferrochelatase [Thiomonas sp. CB2]VDY07071.1 ferrochelatase [Thiomonas sp. Bio17B3]